MIYLLPSLGLIGFGFGEMLLMFGVVMLLFGAKKLPLLARGLGAGIRNFKGEIQPTTEDDEDEG
ncbi:MAG: twin-arginine translocase TatA/TatE family subunit [Gemmatimonadetes bacterium]|jgi:sec-independent protein translocase protein TatA|nr:twin-arginine translocase TatA/TatE family subunit [Gemmatimonadota bacterium]